MFMKIFFSKTNPPCHNIANGIKPGSNSNTTDTHAADCSKAVWWGVIYVRCINCSYNDMAKCIRLLDKKPFFYSGKVHTIENF